MSAFVCVTCGTQHAPTVVPPTQCRICTDDRQHVADGGQQWTTLEELARSHHVRIERDGGFVGIGIREPFGIPQRALLVPSSAGTIMWDCTSLVTADAVEAITRLGEVSLIAISHPHFYASMVDWSDALGGIPILIHQADADWVMRPSRNLHSWTGDSLRIADDAVLMHLPGHFPGSAVLHHNTAAGQGVMFAGDSLHVTADRHHVTVMHSVPNYMPVGPSVIRDIQHRLANIDFEQLYGFTWGLNISANARHAVDDSLNRYLAAITDFA
jgi:hypothetical protein